jgi:hypothetical protein
MDVILETLFRKTMRRLLDGVYFMSKPADRDPVLIVLVFGGYSVVVAWLLYTLVRWFFAP